MSDWMAQAALLAGQALVGGAATMAVRMLRNLQADVEAIEKHLSTINGKVQTTAQRLDDHEVLCTERHDSHRREFGILRGLRSWTG